MGSPADVLAQATTVLVVDWPTPEVPEALARAGLSVVVHGGPGPGDYTAYDLDGADVVTRHLGCPPAHADLVYSYRPVDELPAIVDTARRLGARAVWVQSGRTETGERDPKGCWMSAEESARARAIVESAGLAFVDRPSIVDVAGRLRRS